MIRFFSFIYIFLAIFLIRADTFADPSLPGGETSNQVENKNSFSLSSRNLEEHMRINFLVGNALFERMWEDSSISKNIAKDGLGPFFSARSCESCHINDGRGHIPLTNKEDKISVVIQISQNIEQSNDYIKNIEDDTYGGQISEFAVKDVLKEADIIIDYKYSLEMYEDGRVVELRRPIIKIDNLNYGDFNESTTFSARIAQPMIGLGLIEHISDQSLLMNEDINDTNNDGVSGKANKVWDIENEKLAIGRFGWKAAQPSVYQQTADAFYHDMGLSNKLYSNPFNCTSKQVECTKAISGNSEEYDDLEVSNDQLDLVTFYSSQLGVPARRSINAENVKKGKEIFFALNCNSCHVESFMTGDSGSHANLNNQIIYPYSDFLLHDMGESLSDGVSEFFAQGSEWRTPPLWGIGLASIVSDEYGYLHDGRARTIEEAILWHGGEANENIQNYKKLKKYEVNQLLSFINSL